MKLTWKRQPNETGLARVCQGERGYDLRLDCERVASVRPLDREAKSGWYWYAPSDEALGIRLRNTAGERRRLVTLDEAKAECKAYIAQCIDAALGGSK